MKINYWEILKKAWKIAWKNRYLWWFGFFVSLSWLANFNCFFDSEENPAEQEKIMQFISQNVCWVIIIGLAFFVVWIIFFVLKIIGKGALINSIFSQLQEEQGNFKIGWKKGKENFKKIFLIIFVLGLFILFTIGILTIPVAVLLINHNYIIGFLMAFLAVVIVISLLILTAYLRIFGCLYAILGKLNFWTALEKAYDLFRKNIRSSLIMGIIFIPVNIFLAILFFMLFIPIAVIFFVAGLILYFTAGPIGAIISSVIGLIIFLFFILVIRSVYEVFSQAVWILFFQEIVKTPAPEIIAKETKEEIKSDTKPLPIIELTKK